MTEINIQISYSLLIIQMKTLNIIPLLLSISIMTYSQNLKEKLQGEWICTKILDLNGNTTSGYYGESYEYLKFSFAKSNSSITEAPFDTGIQRKIKYYVDYVDFFPSAIRKDIERIYKVKSIDSTNLILSTTNLFGKQIEYHFINQVVLFEKLLKTNQTIDCGLIIIKHLKLPKQGGFTRVFDYRIGNDTESLFPSPIFNNGKASFYYYSSGSFGHYFTTNFNFPKTYQIETISEELIVDFDISEKGVSNIKIVQGLSNEMNSELINVIAGTTNKWQQIKFRSQSLKTTLRFRFIFYLGVDKFG